MYKKRFVNLLNASEHHYDEIVMLYGESHRVYHNFEHIKACLNHFDSIKDQLENPLGIELAIWFHDVIYDPKSNKNEENSAEYAKRVLSELACDIELIEQVYDLIALTKHPSQPSSSDEKYLLDIDLSILGSKEEAFKEYEKSVRDEYKSVPNFLYRLGRKKILKNFLNQVSIYQTDYFRVLLEQQARNNIGWAIRQL